MIWDVWSCPKKNKYILVKTMIQLSKWGGGLGPDAIYFPFFKSKQKWHPI